MKKAIIVLAAIVLVAGVAIVCAQAASSQTTGSAAANQSVGPWRQRAIELSDELKLTDDQKSKIKDILQQQELKIREIRLSTKTQIDAVLTPDQKTKLDEIREKAKERMKATLQERRGKTAGTQNSGVK